MPILYSRTLPVLRDSSSCPAKLHRVVFQKHSCFRMHAHPVKRSQSHSRTQCDRSGMHTQHLLTCRDMWHNNRFTLIILFLWLWQAKIIIDIEMWIIVQPYNTLFASLWCGYFQMVTYCLQVHSHKVILLIAVSSVWRVFLSLAFLFPESKISPNMAIDLLLIDLLNK